MEMRADDNEASPRWQTWFDEAKARDEGRRRASSKAVAMVLYNPEGRQNVGFLIVIVDLRLLSLVSCLRPVVSMAHDDVVIMV
jgi:hypothetical protein